MISGRLTHAYLFVGTRGTGKTTCAKILSRVINCESPVDGDPCNVCKSCIGIENGSILDVLELDAASNNGVDNVRALRDEAIYSPATVKKRVYIIDEVHMLSTAAFNALLKILEEPPDHLLFILATTELHKVPATILSRCQRFSFKRLSPSAIAARLKSIAEKEDLTLTDEAAGKLATLADGSMRDGISLLDQCASDTVVDINRVLDTIGLAGQQELLFLADAIAKRETTKAIETLDKLYNDGKDMAALLGELSALIRDLLVFALSADSPLLSCGFSRAELAGLSKRFTPERLFSYLDVIREAVFGLSRSGVARLSVEMCIIRMCDERLSDDTSALLSRVARLESDAGQRNAQIIMQNAEIEDEDERREPEALITTPLEMACDDAEVEAEVACDDEGSGPEAEVACDDEGSKPEAEVARDDVDSEAVSEEAPERGFWDEILELLKGDAAIHALLNDSQKIHAELRESTLIISAGDIFTAGSIKSETNSKLLKDAAVKVLGHDIVLRVDTLDTPEETREKNKIDNLRKFGIIKFES